MEKKGKALPAVADKERPRVEQEDAPEFLPEICRQHSVSISHEEDIRDRQGFAYRSPEWDAFHRHARNSIESHNSAVKDIGKEALEEAGRRRVRGFAAAQIFITVLLTNFNLRAISAFLDREIEQDKAAQSGKPPAEKIRRLRDRAWDNTYTKTTASESVLALQQRGQLTSPLRT